MKKRTADNNEKKFHIAGLFGNDKLIPAIVICGMAGICLIFISSYLEPKSEHNDIESSSIQQDSFTADQYKKQLSEELGNMIASIDGAGKTKIMLTLGGTVRNIYATDTDIIDKGSERKTKDNANTEKQNNEKKKYILVKEKDGSEKALTIGQLMPEIKGVLVICEGGGDEQVKEKIIQAVSTALNITKSHICVSALG